MGKTQKHRTGSNFFIHRCLEWRQMILHEAVFRGIYVPLTHLVMGVKAVFTGAAAGEMLHRKRDAVGRNALIAALNAGHNVAHNFGSKLRVFAEGAVAALPTGVGKQIGHSSRGGLPLPTYRQFQQNRPLPLRQCRECRAR